VLVLASSSWVESVAERSFTGHMIQHLLMIVVAAPLLVVAEPWRTVARAMHVPSSRAGRRALATWHRGAPLVALVLFVAVLFVSHLTSIYDRSLHDRLLHEGEHLAYVASAVVLWAAVRASGRAGAPARIGAVFGVMASSAVLGLILMSARDPLMPTYAVRLGTEPAIDDQRTAAAIMWIGGMLATTPLLVSAFWRWAAMEDAIARRAEALEALADAGTTGAADVSRGGR
jgi:putative membrane protein